ncbi:MAG: penicillin-binding protein, partial [Proteobacteria bacterium]|nr:penicillin-binding protein [Pseudomonadota bacterium]
MPQKENPRIVQKNPWKNGAAAVARKTPTGGKNPAAGKNPAGGKKRRPLRIWLRIGLWMLNIALIIAVAVGVYVLIIFLKMPPMDTLLRETRPPSITFVDKDGYEIRSTNKIMGTPLSTTSVPPYVWQSIIAIEDKRFFDHGAIDLRGIARSAFANLRAGAIVSGGSTLTQQVAKNIFLNRQRTISRKVQELIFSYWLENRFTKDQIIDLYMNRVSLVRGMRGIDAAAREIFQKTASDLTLAEAAQIAAMLKAPSTYSPVKNPDKNIARARIVLTDMVRQKYVTLAAAQDAAAHLFPVTESAADTNIFRYWTDYVTDELSSRVGENIGDDLIVYTTLDPDLQERAASVLKRRAAAVKDDVKPQGAVIAMSR